MKIREEKWTKTKTKVKVKVKVRKLVDKPNYKTNSWSSSNKGKALTFEYI